MVKPKIAQLAKSKGFKSSTDFANAAGLTRAEAARLFQGRMKMIGLVTINVLCYWLDCQPGELFEYKRDKKPPQRGAK